MIRKIYWTIVLIIFFVSLFILGNQILIHQFRISSEKLLLEYNELYTLQDFRSTVVQFQNKILEVEAIENQQINVDSIYNELNQKKESCERHVTPTHLDLKWHDLLIHFGHIISILNEKPIMVSNQIIDRPTREILQILNYMIRETKDEITETVFRNNTIQKHGSLTILLIGLLFIALIFVITYSTAKGITTPIREFLLTFKSLESGQKDKRVNFISNTEFGKLAKEFNKLFDTLNSTTVTLEYVKNIMDNLSGALFVTDLQGKIQSCNLAATKLLEIEENEIINKQINIFFNNPVTDEAYVKKDEKLKIVELIKRINKSTEIYTSNGKSIPVMNTCTELKLSHENGLIVVAHNISDKIAYEKQLEEIKQKHLVIFNEAQEEERTRIASDLHDGLGQKLSAISYSLQNLYESGEKKEPINKLQIMVDEAIHETRTISHSLMPGELKDFGLLAALRDLIGDYNNFHEIKIVFNHFGFKERIDAKLEKALFRICQEALNNIIKHSMSQNATFQLFKTDDLITLTIEDDGIGIKQKNKLPSDNGIGLLSIKERVYSFKGNFILNSSENRGTEIIIEIPYT